MKATWRICNCPVIGIPLIWQVGMLIAFSFMQAFTVANVIFTVILLYLNICLLAVASLDTRSIKVVLPNSTTVVLV